MRTVHKKTKKELQNDLMRKQHSRKIGVKSLYDLTESELETLLEVSTRYSNECNVYKENLRKYELDVQNAKSLFNAKRKIANDGVLQFCEQYSLLLNKLIGYRVGLINRLFQDTFEYTTYWSGVHQAETHKYSFGAKAITVEMDKLRSLYDAIFAKLEEIKTNIWKSMVPQKPERPYAVFSAWHNSFSLIENTPTKIRKVMLQTNQSQDLRAKATAYDNKQRIEACVIKRKIVHQMHMYPLCPYCGDSFAENDAHADHIYPVSKGGQSTIKNMVFTCSKCNSKKRDLTLRNFISKYELNVDFIHKNLEILGKDF